MEQGKNLYVESEARVGISPKRSLHRRTEVTLGIKNERNLILRAFCERPLKKRKTNGTSLIPQQNPVKGGDIRRTKLTDRKTHLKGRGNNNRSERKKDLGSARNTIKAIVRPNNSVARSKFINIYNIPSPLHQRERRRGGGGNRNRRGRGRRSGKR